MRKAYNRTCEELKLRNLLYIGLYPETYNRTCEELKYSTHPAFVNNTASYNRTCEELKFASPNCSTLVFDPIIVPVRN